MCVELFIIFLYFPLNICGVCSDGSSYVPDIGNLCILSFFFVSLSKGLSVLLSFQRTSFGSIYFSYCFYIFNLFDFPSSYFFSYACFGLNMLFFFKSLLMKTQIIALSSFFFYKYFSFFFVSPITIIYFISNIGTTYAVVGIRQTVVGLLFSFLRHTDQLSQILTLFQHFFLNIFIEV